MQTLGNLFIVMVAMNFITLASIFLCSAKQLIHLVGLLCNDSKPSVKGTICLQLPLICQCLKPRESNLQYLNTLAKDVDAYVKASLIFTICKVFAMPEMKTSFLEILQINT